MVNTTQKCSNCKLTSWKISKTTKRPCWWARKRMCKYARSRRSLARILGSWHNLYSPLGAPGQATIEPLTHFSCCSFCCVCVKWHDHTDSFKSLAPIPGKPSAREPSISQANSRGPHSCLCCPPLIAEWTRWTIFINYRGTRVKPGPVPFRWCRFRERVPCVLGWTIRFGCTVKSDTGSLLWFIMIAQALLHPPEH